MARAVLLSLVVVAAALRLYKLGSQLWLDEVVALQINIRRPPIEILLAWAGPSSHALTEGAGSLLIHLAGESAFAVRLPAAICGIATVWALYRLASATATRLEAVFVAALCSVSFHHIFHSQNARGYTALILFATIATWLVIRFRQSDRMTHGDGILYVASTVLAAYSQITGAVIAPAHMLAATALWITGRSRGRFPFKRFFAYATGSIAIVALAYMPFFLRLLRAPSHTVSDPGEGHRLRSWLLLETIEGLTTVFRGPMGLLIATVLALTGAISLYRRSRFGFLALIAPPAIVLPVLVVLGTGVHPRYLALAFPSALLIGGIGVASAVGWITDRVRAAPEVRSRLTASILALVVAISAAPLPGYYRYPKQDYLGAIAVVEQSARPGDIKVAAHLSDRVINMFYRRDYARVESLDDLQRLEGNGRRVLVVTTLERLLAAHDSALLDHLKARYRVISVLPGTLGDGTMWVYDSHPDQTSTRGNAGS